MTDKDTEDKVAWYQSHRTKLSKVLAKALDKGTKRIKARMDRLLTKCGEAGGFESPAKLRQFLKAPLTSSELSDLYTLADLLPDGDERDRILSRLTAESYKHGWTREKAFKESVEIETKIIVQDVLSSGQKTIEQLGTSAYGQAMFGLQKSASLGFTLSEAPTKLIDKAIKSTFSASRTVGYIKTVTYAMRESFLSGLMAGESTDQIARDMAQVTNRKTWVAKAYARTMLCEVSNQVEKDTLKKAGLSKYTYTCTLDEKTCPVCGRLDGKTFLLSESEPGKNFPPMHRNCRCTTSPALTKEAKSRITRQYSLVDEDGRKHYDEVPRSMTYSEWAEKYYPAGRIDDYGTFTVEGIPKVSLDIKTAKYRK